MKKCLTEELVLIILYSYIWGLNHKKYKMNLKSFKVAAAAMVMVGMVFTGCTGEDGDDGPAGNANVQSDTYTVIDTDWSGGRATFYHAGISQSVVNSGTVQTFFTGDSITSETEWISLPSGNFSYTYKTDSVVFLTPGFAGANFTTYYKVVAIASGAKIEGLDENSYEELQMVYGFED